MGFVLFPLGFGFSGTQLHHYIPESPNIPFQSLERPDEQEHHPNTCWKDIYDSLKNANEIICIIGT